MEINILVITDIFGLTDNVFSFVKDLDVDSNILICDPYKGTKNKFLSEKEAYLYFMDNVGLESYYKKAISMVKDIDDSLLFVVGFSVGATAAWRIASSEILCQRNMLIPICFYGSQIRKYLDNKPAVKTDIILANFEKSFDVEKHYQDLKHMNNVICHSSDYGHGFMNRLSENYSSDGYIQYVDFIRSKITDSVITPV